MAHSSNLQFSQWQKVDTTVQQSHNPE